ncbi:hypothetical protein AA102526_2698 [Asaia lannensis NBRC 102526]|nr:hypothetical protein AA102526_2698 [Asaia lannensis NBRC 102526]
MRPAVALYAILILGFAILWGYYAYSAFAAHHTHTGWLSLVAALLLAFAGTWAAVAVFRASGGEWV